MRTPLDAESYDLGRISAHIELIRHDARPAACLTIRNEMVQSIVRDISSQGLLCEVSNDCGTHSDIHIFRHEHLRSVINEIGKLKPPFRDWVYGRLYGYSEAEIAKFIEGKNSLRWGPS